MKPPFLPVLLFLPWLESSPTETGGERSKNERKKGIDVRRGKRRRDKESLFSYECNWPIKKKTGSLEVNSLAVGDWLQQVAVREDYEYANEYAKDIKAGSPELVTL